MCQRAARRCGTDAGQHLQHAERGDGISRVFDPSQYAKNVLDMRRLKKLQPAIFDERDAATPELDFKLVAMMARAEQDCLSFQVDAGFAMLQYTLNDVLDLCRFIGGNDQLRRFPGWFIGK